MRFICLHCGTEFWRKGKRPRKYCSTKCHGLRYFTPKRVRERFDAKVKPGKPNECWPWRTRDGKEGTWYGILTVNHENVQLHRMALSIHLRRDLLDDEWVLHKCDNPACCNPRHLFIGTAKDNSLDMVSKGRNAVFFGEDHPGAKLTAAKVRRARKMRANRGTTYKTLASVFGVSERCIRSAVQGKTWADA